MSYIKTIKKLLVVLAVGVLVLLPSSAVFAATGATCQDGSQPNATTGLCKDGNCPDGSQPDGSGNCRSAADGISCGAGSFDWVVCPIIDLAQKTTQAMDNLITNTLNVDVKQIFDTGKNANAQNAYYAAWNTFRILAIGILLIGGLIMIIAQAVGMELLDAYTIRKVLPRLLIAIIGITLSWQLMRFVINFFDVLGFDVRSLIYAPFKNIPGANISGTTSIFTTGIAGLVILAGFAPAALTFVLGGFIAVFFGFLVLVFRQIAIVLIVIVAPVAIACYILPNTQRFWKLWYDNFLALMLMFPIASAFIAASHAFSAIALAGGGTTQEVIGIVAYFLPYFMLLQIFKMSKGLMGTVAGVAGRYQSGGLQRVKQLRANSAKKAWQNIQDNNRFKGGTATNRRGWINKQLQRGSGISKDRLTIDGFASGFKNGGGIRGSLRAGLRSNLAAVDAGTSAGRVQRILKAAESSAAFAAFKGNDDRLEAAKRYAISGNMDDARAHLEEKGYKDNDLEESLGLIRQARSDLGSDTLGVASVIHNAGTGTGNPRGAGQMFDDILKASGGDMTVAIDAYAQARGMAERSRRVDLLGGGFGEGLTALRDIGSARTPEERTAAIEEATLKAGEGAWEKQGIGAIINGRPESAAILSKARVRMLRNAESDMKEAQANGGQIIREVSDPATGVKVPTPVSMDQLEREYIQLIASTSALIDYAGSAAPGVARTFADTTHNEVVDTSALPDHIRSIIATPNPDGTPAPATMAYSEVMKKLEANAPEIYGQVKKIYTNEAMSYQQRMISGGFAPPGGGPPGGPPGGRPPGP